MARTTSSTLGNDLEDFVQEQVESGAYASASEVLREALRRMAEEERKEQQLMAALDAGTASPRARPGVWERVHARVRRTQTKR